MLEINVFLSFILNLLYIIAFIKNIVTNRNKKNNFDFHMKNNNAFIAKKLLGNGR